VRAVGTAFNVRLGAATVEVLVTEGQVRVNSSGSAHAPGISILRIGQRAVVPLSSGSLPPQVTHVSAEEIAYYLGWKPKLLEFASTPLKEVVAEFNRRNHVQLVIADPALCAVPIVASFRSDNIDGFVRLLELSAGVQAERDGDTIALRRAN
jgi:transmembrane sensor